MSEKYVFYEMEFCEVALNKASNFAWIFPWLCFESLNGIRIFPSFCSVTRTANLSKKITPVFKVIHKSTLLKKKKKNMHVLIMETERGKNLIR